jgi:hypothetical protein
MGEPDTFARSVAASRIGERRFMIKIGAVGCPEQLVALAPVDSIVNEPKRQQIPINCA